MMFRLPAMECRRRCVGDAGSQGIRSRPAGPNFTVHLERPPGRREPSREEVDDLVRSCFPRPDGVAVLPHRGGLAVARLFFRQWKDTLSAVAYLWRRRLAAAGGGGLLVPRVTSAVPEVASDREEEREAVRSLFVSLLRDLLAGELVGEVERRAAQERGNLEKVRKLLSKPKRLGVMMELRQTEKGIAAELELLEGRVREFKHAVACLLRLLGDSSGGGSSDVELFELGEGWDWDRIHCLILRECRRLKEGLPIYASRKKILKSMFENQVVVLIGETGSGKSTQLVQFLADSGLADKGSIVCTQPRKIAAISLARRVMNESDGCYANRSVVSFPTYSSSQVFNSRMIFMTDHCLLQHCMNDKNLHGISYIIVDEAHERSLSTDLLLALVKKRLLEGLDLRLLVMSATADANKLADYFCGCCIFNVVGRNFPVEIKYIPDISTEVTYMKIPNVNSCRNASYVSDVIKTAHMIHKTEGTGGILAFLTSQMEVEWACENFKDSSAEVLPLHGKLSFDEQNRVFHSFPGKRKVIFSTNVAETSLTISGVKYVIDSGLAKENRFEPGSGMNVLKVSMISQSSANQRAGRAGRTEPGKCYRLYSECDFQLMKAYQEPEIRKVHLGIAILRILALGIRCVQDFDYIDAPSPQSINKALKNLVHLGAVAPKEAGYQLTDIGVKLVKLDIEPRLGKMILDCFSIGLMREALVLGALMANSGSMFCRVGSDEEKLKADCLKVPFCHRDGDLFTHLAVYKEWENLKIGKNQWCWDNGINAKSMRRCQDTVMELETCFCNELGITVPKFWLWDDGAASEHNKFLKAAIFSSLSENVAMYSGHDRIGYVVAQTGEHVQLHPSCSLLAYSEKPSWVVFGDILSVSNQYLVCVTAVDYDCLHTVKPSLFDISQLEFRKLQKHTIEVAGGIVLRRLCGKNMINLNTMIAHIEKICMGSRINIDINVDNGEIHLFASGSDMEKALCVVNDVLEHEKKWLKDECTEKLLFHGGFGSASQVALFGAGAIIRHLELENRYLTVEILHPKAHDIMDRELLYFIDGHVSGVANYSRHVKGLQESLSSSKCGKVTFLSPDAAEDAVIKLNMLEFHGSLLTVIPVNACGQKSLPYSAVRARVCWPRRCSKGVALIHCGKEDIRLVIKDIYTLSFEGTRIRCGISTKFDNSVFVSGIPKGISELEVRDAIMGAIKRRVFGIQLLRGDAAYDPPCTVCEEALKKELSAFMPNKNLSSPHFRVEVFNPEPKDYMVKAIISFDGNLHLEAARALDHLQGMALSCCASWQKMMCEHVFHTSVFVPVYIYAVIGEQLNSLIGSFERQDGAAVRLEKVENGSFRVKITANATKIVADMRKPFEELVAGKTVSHPSLPPSSVDPFQSYDVARLKQAIERETGTCILYERRTSKIRVYGPPDRLAEAEEKLVYLLLEHHKNKQWEIHLRGTGLPPTLMREVVRLFGPDLGELKAMVPGGHVILRPFRHILLVRGSNEHKQQVEEAISNLVTSLDSRLVMKPPGSEGSDCPICLCAIQESYKLENCGHRFCRSCLVDQCEAAIKSRGGSGFPLSCTKEGCGSPMLLVDIRSLLSYDKLEELFRASLTAFMAASSGVYRFCPTPECPGIYHVTTSEATTGFHFVCGACSNETCTSCHLEYHPFVTCEMYREFKDHPDLSLEEWRRGKEHVRNCPSCYQTIEKTDGCNHVECRCGCHICWFCMEVYKSSEECYAHLRTVHNGIA